MAEELQNARIPELPPKGGAKSTNLLAIYDEQDDVTKKVTVKDLLTSQDLSFPWEPNVTYASGAIVVYGEKIWKSLQNANLGNIPTENTFWQEQSKSPSSVLRYWQAGVYGSGDVFVVRQVSGVKAIYELLVAQNLRPFLSSSFDTELAAGKWGIIGGGSGGSSMAVFATIAARNTAATGGSLTPNQIVRVTDATGDSTVSAGRAYYEYLGTGTSFNKISEEESLDLDFATFTRNSTGENNLDITPANATFFTGILTSGKAKLKAIIDHIVSKIGYVIGDKVLSLTGLATGKHIEYNGTQWVLVDKPATVPATGAAAWSSATTYAIDIIVEYQDKLYQSLQNSNTNQNPVTATAYWVEVSKSEPSGLKAWAAGVYGSGMQAVVFTDNKIYKLADSVTRPFNSTNFATELAASKWVELSTSVAGLKERYMYVNTYQDLTTDIELFKGQISNIAVVQSSIVSSYSFEVKLDSASTWTPQANITALNAYIAGISSSTLWNLRIVIVPAASTNGEGFITLQYS